ncbi:aminopeptidase N [Aliikangiella maris]|uniref:Aminopeptidase N n=2 Tax=Aliikangiella maris TaxID=3162458 RepID=A0ABV3MRI9_9GAMM
MSSSTKPVVKFRKNYKPSPYLIKNTELIFQLFEDHVLVSASLNIESNPKSAESVNLPPMELDGVALELLEISIDDKELSDSDYQLKQDLLIIQPTTAQFNLQTLCKIYPQKNTSLEGLYTSGGKFCTQCEAEGFRKITYYLDRPEIMSAFSVRIEGDQQKYPLLLSNGNPASRGDLTDGRHFVEWHDPFPKPCYLFALVAGDLDCLEDEFTTMNGRKVKLELFVDKGKLDQCQFAMDSLKASMRWDEEKFGREYDLDLYMVVAVSDFNMGAMENKGLNIFNTKYVLANEKTATDADFEGVERVIAHEYFHNWTGNRVTCRDWFQLSLKEGLTVFRDQKFSEDMQSKPVQRIDQVKIIRSAQFAEDSGPMAHPIRPDSYIEMNNFYTVTVYNKGAEVINMMHTLLGEAGFRKGMDLYFERHDGQAVTCEDFVRAMEEANDVDWTQFRNWYSQAGTPLVNVKLTQLGAGQFHLDCEQSCPPTPEQQSKSPFMIPIKTGFLDAAGNSLKFKVEQGDWTDEALLILTENKQSFKIECDAEQIIPSLLRDFSAPIKLAYEYSLTQLATQFASDPNSFNRWDAGQNLMSRLLLSNSPTLSATDKEIVEQAFSAILHDEQLDNALKALAVQLPSLNSLIGQSDKVDLDQLFNKSNQLKQHLAKSLEPVWFSIYNTLAGDNAGARWLRNVALSYLLIASEAQYFELAANQITHATNMTDELAALQVIAKSKNGFESEYVEQFYQKWQNEDLVLDKWFSAQVLNEQDNVIDYIRSSLLEHEKFSIGNPNKVHSVISTFSANNLVQFHHASGAGYALLADLVIQLNQINPQIAGRLATQFNQWKKLDSNRQTLIKSQLSKIISIDALSNDVFEVVDKSLKM